MSENLLTFNGIDARTGNYLLQLEPEELVAVARGEPLDPSNLGELKFRNRMKEVGDFEAIEGVNLRDIGQAGWGVVFPLAQPGSPEELRQAAILDALRPLLELRRAQASRVDARFYQAYTGLRGVRPDETKQKWLARHGAGPGPADPKTVPYYLLLVGDPTAIPYRFQSQVGVQRAVGRVYFETLDEYARYAQSVVEAETPARAVARRASFFGVANPDDAATQASAKHLVAPIADMITADPRFASWAVERKLGPDATRAALADLIGRDAPALLFTASHGMGFPMGDPLQLRHQGALLCQDWPGPNAWRGKAIPEDFYLAGDHLSADTNLLGSIAFLFACYGAGTPELDEFSRQAFKARAPIAPHAFVAGLPTALLNRPKGGALAVIGHVERAWGHSFLWAGTGGQGKTGPQTAVFESAVRALMDGMPVGAAMEYFDTRYAELSSDLSVQLEDIENGVAVDEYALAGMWTANNDARGYAILGDPAVRLTLADTQVAEVRTPIVVNTAAPAAVPTPDPTPVPGSTSSFGIVDAVLGRERAPAEPGAIARFVTRMGETLTTALEDATTLEVSTWVADDMSKAHVEQGRIVGGELRALTRVSLDGDTIVCLPRKDGEVDQEVWAIHAEMVRQAQATRAELLKTLVAAASSLAGLIK